MIRYHLKNSVQTVLARNVGCPRFVVLGVGTVLKLRQPELKKSPQSNKTIRTDGIHFGVFKAAKQHQPDRMAQLIMDN